MWLILRVYAYIADKKQNIKYTYDLICDVAYILFKINVIKLK